MGGGRNNFYVVASLLDILSIPDNVKTFETRERRKMLACHSLCEANDSLKLAGKSKAVNGRIHSCKTCMGIS